MSDEEVAIWDRRYQKESAGATPDGGDPWLERWRPLLTARVGQALDLGCGVGFDTEVLLRWGFEVTAVDFSGAAIALSRRRNPRASHSVLDLRQLALQDGTFDLVVASLSLHYFDRTDTKAIFRNIRRLLRRGGHLAFRVNAFDDHQFGAVGDATSSWERVVVNGVHKQFFTHEKIAEAAGSQWVLHSEEKRTIGLRGQRKSLFEVILEKPNQ